MNQIEKIPWPVRLNQVPACSDNPSPVTPQPCRQFLQEPVASVMLGAALMSGQPSLRWSAQKLLDEVIQDDETRLRTSGWTLLAALLERLRTAVEALDEEKELAGYTLLFHFLVEPFALMYQSTAFYPVGGVPRPTQPTN